MVHFLLSSFAVCACSIVWPFVHWPHFAKKFTVCELRLGYYGLECEYFFRLFDLFLLVSKKLLQRGHTSSCMAFRIILLFITKLIILMFIDLIWVFHFWSGKFKGGFLFFSFNNWRFILILFDFLLLFPIVFENIFDLSLEFDFVVTFSHGLYY